MKLDRSNLANSLSASKCILRRSTFSKLVFESLRGFSAIVLGVGVAALESVSSLLSVSSFNTVGSGSAALMVVY